MLFTCACCGHEWYGGNLTIQYVMSDICPSCNSTTKIAKGGPLFPVVCPVLIKGLKLTGEHAKVKQSKIR